MNSQSFYIELSSNAPSYKDNTVANFKNDINLTTPLNGYWDVALVEISYTKSWLNLKDISMIELFHLVKQAQKYSLDTFDIDYFIIKHGYYPSIEKLVTIISNQLKAIVNPNIKKLPRIRFDIIEKFVYITPGETVDGNIILFDMSEELKEVFGLPKYSIQNSQFSSNKEIMGIRPPDINASLHTLFVYCDIIEPQYIGDIRARLLKTVEVPTNYNFGEQIVVKYDNPHYVPVIINDFEHIEIHIKDDTNRDFGFLFGRSRVKLHFRKRND